jgi:hypothetical protein
MNWITSVNMLRETRHGRMGSTGRGKGVGRE